MTDSHADEEMIFTAARGMADPGVRSGYLREACGADTALRHRIEALLAVDDGPRFLLDRPAAAWFAGSLETPSASSPDRPGERVGSVIGPYKLVRPIGEGGMGTVYLAEQSHPVHRTVAVKVIKPGMDSREVVARFETERQALAMMDHAHIARVFDAGTTDTGLPYFVMELVQGAPITSFCDDHRLTPTQRLELFLPVCQAIQHAHSKGIIHRDVKPANVLVSVADGRPVPKVIDFGVAKATTPSAGGAHLTRFGTLVGTPEYMSPEQAELNDAGIDTRSDVYALGVLLYELLTGSTPFGGERLRAAPYGEVLRVIRDEEPLRPSTRLAESGETAAVADRRHTPPAQLVRQIRGDLDWIVMKALEKDRDRRYETAAALAADVQRYLRDEAVEAGPATAGYRVRKFVRRNRSAVRATAAVAALLVAAVAVSTWQAVRATDAETAARAAERAVGVERDTARAETARANEEADIAKAVNDLLLNDLLAEAAPERNGRGDKVTVEDLLGRAAARVADKFESRPRTEAAIRQTIGDAYRTLGDYPAALPHLERALDLRRRHLGEDHADTLTTMTSLGLLNKEMARLGTAESILLATLDARRRTLGEDHPDTIRSTINVAAIHIARGTRLADAEALLTTTVDTGRRGAGLDRPDMLKALNMLAQLRRRQGRSVEAESTLEEAVDRAKRVLGDRHPDTLLFMNNLAEMYWRNQKRDPAITLFEETLRLRTDRLGSDHPYTLFTALDLGMSYLDVGRSAEAIPVLDDALARIGKRPGPLPFELALLVPSVAEAYERADLFPKAEPLRRDALEKMRSRHGPDARPLAGYLFPLASNLLRQERHAEAESLLRECLRIQEKYLPDDWSTAYVRSHLGGSLLGQKKYAEAEPLLLSGYEGLKTHAGTLPADRRGGPAEAAERLMRLYEASGDGDKAAEWRMRWEREKEAVKSSK